MAIKKILWFNARLVLSGGGERLSLESVQQFIQQKIEVRYVIFFASSKKVFDGEYDHIPFRAMETGEKIPPVGLLEFIRRIRWLTKEIRNFQPDVVITQGTWSQVIYLWPISFVVAIPYAVHIFGSLFAFTPKEEKTKFGIIFRSVFDRIRKSQASYQEVVPQRYTPSGVREWFSIQLFSLLKYLSIRKAAVRFVLSERNRQETQLLYGKDAVVLQGAFPMNQLEYRSGRDFKQEIGLQGKTFLLSVCRLAKNKRIDLAIQGFALAQKEYPSLHFVIGGTGSESEYLKELASSLGLTKNITFLGFVKQRDLYDLILAGDLFIHLDLADFDIAPLEALALGRKVLWCDEMDLPILSAEKKFVFECYGNPFSVAEGIRTALSGMVTKSDVHKLRKTMEQFSWEHYAANMVKSIEAVL